MNRLINPAALITEEVNFDGHRFSVLRLDKIHPITGGNKWFKLVKNIAKFRAGGYEGILSFGGPFSNHIAALAAVCNEENIPCVGIIRGEEEQATNSTLSRTMKDGMKLKFVSRTIYRQLRDPAYREMFFHDTGNYLIIPEGGSNDDGVEGCGMIAEAIDERFTDVMVAVGTGATFAGIRKNLSPTQRLWGIKVVDARQELLIEKYTGLVNELSLSGDYIFGGYARKAEPLQQFVDRWNREVPVPIEPIYTGRLFYAANDMLRKGVLGENPRLLVIHSGGLQYLGD